MPSPPELPHHEEPFDRVVAALGDFLAKPGEDLPSVRCISHRRLIELTSATIQSLSLGSGVDIPSVDVVDRLLQINLLQPISLDATADHRGSTWFYAIGFGADAADIHPFELLQSLVPAGVICYMSALEQHDLTTQPSAQHHIARLETAPTRLATEAKPRETTVTETPRVARIPSLGTWRFTYRGLKYYQTARDPKLLRSYQRRYLSDKSWYRITTLEQTLVDTLHRPMSCGGPAVVFEAWRTGAERADVNVLADLIGDIGDDRLMRRAGYMSQHTGGDLSALADRLANSTKGTADATLIPLFPGVQFANSDPTWGLMVP